MVLTEYYAIDPIASLYRAGGEESSCQAESLRCTDWVQPIRQKEVELMLSLNNSTEEDYSAPAI